MKNSIQMISIWHDYTATICGRQNWQVSIATNLDFDLGNRWIMSSLIAKFMGPTWGPPGADRTQMGPMLATWTLLSELTLTLGIDKLCHPTLYNGCNYSSMLGLKLNHVSKRAHENVGADNITTAKQTTAKQTTAKQTTAKPYAYRMGFTTLT